MDNIDLMFTQIQDEIDSSTKLGRSRLVDPKIMHDMIESVRAQLPTVIERAKEIVAKRNEILENARAEADALREQTHQSIAQREATFQEQIQEATQKHKEHAMSLRAQGEQHIADAKAEAERLLAGHEITQNAKVQAEQLLHNTRAQAEQEKADARARADKTIADANAYSNEQIRRTQEWGQQYTGSVSGVVQEIVNEAEEILARSLEDVRATQKRLQTSMMKSAVPPDFYPADLPLID
ncbi:MAG: hypothetical protein FWB76_04345 [Oscillospiraceae bacterium]|nr:hypothetical protein [Oscillospiraceae bacterium]